MKLRHLWLPGLTSYTKASSLQDGLVRAVLAHKANPQNTPAPEPTVLTAEFYPVYTCGRREINTISAEQQDYLRTNGAAEFHEALRGGQTTFHGPGQLVAYPIIDLRRHKISVRDYVCLLEKSVISTCAKWGIEGKRTENPGVWTDNDHKLAAVGVHLRRNVTSHGIGLNINTDLSWFERIVACGLEGKFATSFKREGVQDLSVRQVADEFIHQIAVSIGVDDMQTLQESEIPLKS